tara:strand:- start:897 stop:1373 length:477 start_codon:yes stop_codon:yes gene_type:complete
MKLSHIHIHEDKAPSLEKTLADYLNNFKVYPYAFQSGSNVELFEITLMLSNRPRSNSGVELPWYADTRNPLKNPFKTIGYEQVKYEPTPEPGDPLDNIGKNTFGEDFAMFAAMIEGANKFEGQFAWYNEDLISNEQIVQTRSQRGYWKKGKLPKFPAV